MRRRLRFLGLVLTHARPWTWGVIGGSLNLLALLAALGLIATSTVPPLWVTVGYLMAVLVVGQFEGAYRTWDEAERGTANQEAADEHAKFQGDLRAFTDHLSGFVTGREHGRPPGGNIGMKGWQDDFRRAAAYRAETVGRYHEEFRPGALRLLDEAERLGYLTKEVDRGQLLNVDHPDDLGEVVDVFETLVGGVERTKAPPG